MLSFGQASAIEESAWFQAKWAPYLLLDADLRIRAVNTAYERATEQPRSSLLGELLFEAFPENPAVPGADGVTNVSRSLEHVFRRGARHWMGVQRYDVPDPGQPGGFIDKVWTPVNYPIKDGGRTVAVLHRTQDVTRVMPSAAAPVPTELRHAAKALGREFPGLPAEAVLSVLIGSLDVVIDTLGTPDIERAVALARLRLEAHSGDPTDLASDDRR